jgi:penicillin G amidase
MRPLALALVSAAIAAFIGGPLWAKEPQASTRTVTIKRDSYGTPHIYAADVFGLFYGYGYSVAQDRLFQMEMARRSFTGRVAEVLGERFVDYDKSVRSNYKPDSIARQLERLPKQDQAIFDGYAAGFNTWVREVLAKPSELMPEAVQ